MRLVVLLVAGVLLAGGCGSSGPTEHDKATARIGAAWKACSNQVGQLTLGDDGHTISGDNLHISYTDSTSKQMSADAVGVLCVLSHLKVSTALGQQMFNFEKSGTKVEHGVTYRWKRTADGFGTTLNFIATTVK